MTVSFSPTAPKESIDLPELNPAPIAIFAFNREDLARALVASLEQNPAWLASKVYVFIDGPRTEAERAKTEAVRGFFEAINHPDMVIQSRPVNIGLKTSLSSGLLMCVRCMIE
ncbi:hypothetical protein [Frigidibacter mobilis]|uniref:hypothetical protein n=1 Tax=Frigidibacter mobilis TaxID=1335048 RepID=UPI001412E3B5|nr:hypothetical protein [Frigidibacter mobilis]